MVNCARAIVGLSASSPGENAGSLPGSVDIGIPPVLSVAGSAPECTAWVVREHRPSVRRPTADRWVPPVKLGTLHERCACAGAVSRETSSESLKDRSRSDSDGGVTSMLVGVHIGVRERDTQTPSPGELPVLCRAMNTMWDLMHSLTRRTEFCSARDCVRRVSSLGTEPCSGLLDSRIRIGYAAPAQRRLRLTARTGQRDLVCAVAIPMRWLGVCFT